MIDRTRFTISPQLDSEGFAASYDAGNNSRCYGCTPDEMCPRSGSCEFYASPLRVDHSVVYVDHTMMELANAHNDGLVLRRCPSVDELLSDHNKLDLHPYPADLRDYMQRHPENPEGWQEAEGVKLPPINWGTVADNIGQGAANAFKALIDGRTGKGAPHRHKTGDV